jgi:hypothetical protein
LIINLHIFLTTGKKLSNFDKNKIKDSILEQAVIQLAVELSVKESYINNADPDAVPRLTVNTIKSELGRIYYKLNMVTNLELEAITNDTMNPDLKLRLDNLLAEAQDLSKLSVEEKDELDLDLEISEFDAAIKKTKTNTSPGIDGISNHFIKKFWHIFRVPLFNYSVYCLNRSSLTENFRIAKVRLIQKKMTQKKFQTGGQ